MLKLLLGAGCALLIVNLKNGGPFDVHMTASFNAAFGTLVGILLCTISVFLWRRRFMLPKRYGIFLLAVYLLFAIASVMLELNLVSFG